MRVKIKSNKISLYQEPNNLGKLLQALLITKGFNLNDAYNFIDSENQELSDPFLIYGMKEASDFINMAIDENKTFVIHGDFDVDGVCATTILWDYLYNERKAKVHPIIPHRVDEGYGLSEKTIEKAIEFNADVLITVDCGVKDIDIVKKYQSKLNFVITDHHQFSTNSEGNPILPEAKAVVHSAHPDGVFPSMISGAATSWQLVRALESSKPIKSSFETEQYLDLVALSTICDIIPLNLENRKLVQKGLRKFATSKRPGLEELMRISSVNPNEINAYHCGFVLGPRLNAPGRVTNDATDSLRLLATKNLAQTEGLAIRLNELNIKRKTLTDEFIKKAQLSADSSKKAIVVLAEKWPEGILGLVAGKLAEKERKPVFVASFDENGHIIGSSRSPLDSFYLNKSLEFASDHLERFGGHKQAAGFASNLEKFKGFEDKILEFIEINTTDKDFEKSTYVDLEIHDLSSVSINEIEEINKLEPFGMENQKPVFLIKKLKIVLINKLGSSGDHLKLKLKDETNNIEIEAIAFGQGNKFESLSIGNYVDIIGCFSINEWQNKKKLQIEVSNIIEEGEVEYEYLPAEHN